MSAHNESGGASADIDMRTQRRRALAAAGAGTFVEYFDYASYGYLATVIAKVFFPTADPVAGLLQTFLLFAASFAIRPVGGLFWGYFGDRFGRTRALTLTIIGIGLATTLIGFLPGFATAGYWAPLLLVLLRLSQGFCTAGEYSGAAVLLGEFAPPGRRGRYVSIVPISSAIGFLVASALASALHATLTTAEMIEWGWRLPFIIGGVITFFGLLMRRGLKESPAFEKISKENGIVSTPVRTLFRNHFPTLARLFCIMGVNGGGYYMVLVYMATYLEVEMKLSPFQAAAVISMSLAVYVPLLLAFAILSDRIGRRAMLLTSSLLFLFCSYPAFALLEPGNVYTAFAIQLFLVAAFALNDSTFAAYFVESVPAATRFSGFALPFNIGVAVFSGTTPLLSTWLIEQTGNKFAPAFIMMGVAAISLPALWRAQKTAADQSDVAAGSTR